MTLTLYHTTPDNASKVVLNLLRIKEQASHLIGVYHTREPCRVSRLRIYRILSMIINIKHEHAGITRFKVFRYIHESSLPVSPNTILLAL